MGKTMKCTQNASCPFSSWRISILMVLRALFVPKIIISFESWYFGVWGKRDLLVEEAEKFTLNASLPSDLVVFKI